MLRILGRAGVLEAKRVALVLSSAPAWSTPASAPPRSPKDVGNLAQFDTLDPTLRSLGLI